ncbi:MAG: hypothetical protein ACR2QJ_08960 [Geminicoccaceae bacterium]
MATTFPRFSSLSADHFRNARFAERMAVLSAELRASKELVEHQCLTAIVLVTMIVYLLVRIVDSAWVLPLILPVVVVGVANLQHAFSLYRHHVRRESLPAICEGIGRLRHTVGEAPDICLDRMVRAGVLPRHGRSMMEDAVFGDYRGHRLSLAMVDLWQSREDVPLDHEGGDLFHGIIVAIRWPERPDNLPSDELTPLIDGVQHVACAWFEGFLQIIIPCQRSPFHIGGLLARPEQLVAELLRAASVIQIPHRLIDFMQEEERVELMQASQPA